MNGRGPRLSSSRIVWWCLVAVCALGFPSAERDGPARTSAQTLHQGQKAAPDATAWDVVVLGRVDACFVCQHGPAPHVRYAKVLAGVVPGAKPQGEFPLVEVAAKLLKAGAIPIYRSEREEICYLKRVPLPRAPETFAYKLIEIEDASDGNLAKFGTVRP